MMFRRVLSMMILSVVAGCGGDGDSPLPSEGEGQGEGEGEGEGEGSPNEGEGDTGEGEGEGSTEGEGEGPLPPGADGEPCGGAGKNECRDGYECLTCEEAGVDNLASEEPCEDRVCTCPQWFEGRWWAEFEPRAVDREFDFMRGNRDRQLWMAHEIAMTQSGCSITGPPTSDPITILGGYPGTEGRVAPPPRGFQYLTHRTSVDGESRVIMFTGTLSDDRRTTTGTCAGEYPDGSVEPTVWFNLTCSFSLTRR